MKTFNQFMATAFLFLAKSDAKIEAQIRQAFMSAGATMANDIEQEMRRYQTELNPQRN